ncbi:MAG: hypothetical protein EOP00_12220, partial [Pedobacter sp.]
MEEEIKQIEFLAKREKWLKEVAEKCHKIANKHGDFPDFYVFQLQSDIYNPDLLIIGANPGSSVSYKDILNKKGIEKRTWKDLGYDKNQYLENENNPEWHINRPILKIFKEVHTRKILANSVIMNVIYFNTKAVADLMKYKTEIEEIKRFCTEKTKEFINLLNPKNILFIGFDAPKWMNIKYHHKNDAVLR